MEKDSSSFPSKSQGLIKGPLVQSCLKTIQQCKRTPSYFIYRINIKNHTIDK